MDSTQGSMDSTQTFNEAQMIITLDGNSDSDYNWYDLMATNVHNPDNFVDLLVSTHLSVTNTQP